MLEAIRRYLQDWSDACEYANECAPDLSFLGNGEPFTALLFIGAACCLVYAINEARIKRRVLASPGATTTIPDELRTVVEQMNRSPAATEKLAA